VWWVIGVLGAVFTGAIALYWQLGDIKADVAAVKASMVSINERLAGLDAGIREVRTAQTTAATTLARIDETTKNPPRSGLLPSPPVRDPPEKVAAFPPNAQLIREVIRPTPTGTRPYSVGEVLGAVTVPLLPATIVGKFPELRGLGCLVDAKAAIALVDANYRVVAIIAPS
jgi:hypothetical protein